MKTIFNKIVLVSSLVFLVNNYSAQQDEQSSLYMFNPLHFNPAYAGSHNDLSVVGVVRAQWVGIKGAPITQFLSAHSPIKAKNMAVGLNLVNDNIGARNRTSFYGNYAYTLHFKNRSKLNLGLSAGGDLMSVDYNKLVAKDADETDYLVSLTKTTFNIGSGLYYSTKRFYLGLSSPRILETKLKNKSILISNAYTKRHFFLSTGYVFPINSILDLKTSMLLKMTANAPITVDLNANLFLNKTWWLGLMYRYNESVGFNFAYQHKESLMIGYGFDFPINGLSSLKNAGSHEIMITYDFNKNKAFGSPRYF